MKAFKQFLKYGPLLIIAIIADIIHFFVTGFITLYDFSGKFAEKYYQKVIDWCDS